MIRTFKNDDTVYYIVADGGGTDDENPFFTLEEALERVDEVDGDETGIDIWRATFADYLRVESGEVDDPEIGTLVWERW